MYTLAGSRNMFSTPYFSIIILIKFWSKFPPTFEIEFDDLIFCANRDHSEILCEAKFNSFHGLKRHGLFPYSLESNKIVYIVQVI